MSQNIKIRLNRKHSVCVVKSSLCVGLYTLRLRSGWISVKCGFLNQGSAGENHVHMMAFQDRRFQYTLLFTMQTVCMLHNTVHVSCLSANIVGQQMLRICLPFVVYLNWWYSTISYCNISKTKQVTHASSLFTMSDTVIASTKQLFSLATILVNRYSILYINYIDILTFYRYSAGIKRIYWLSVDICLT